MRPELKQRYEDLSMEADIIRDQMRDLRSRLRDIRSEMADIRDENASERLNKHFQRYQSRNL